MNRGSVNNVKIQKLMNQKHNFQRITLIRWLVAMVVICQPFASEADDASITNTPATATVPETAPASEATNTPALTSTPENTNTTAPATVTGPAITNTPAAAPVPASTAAPAATATAPATATTAATSTPVTATKATKTPSYQPFNLGAEAGTTGYGGTAGWRFADHFGLVGGVDYLSYSMNHTFNDIPYHAHLHLQSEYAGLNLYPWRDRSFHFSLGAYFNQNRLTGSAVSDGTLIVNGATVPPTDAINLEYKQQPVDPYVAIGGNLYFDKAHHFSLGAELGAFYLGNPRVKVNDSQGLVLQSDLTAYQQKVEHDLKKLPVWPILKLSLNYSF